MPHLQLNRHIFAESLTQRRIQTDQKSHEFPREPAKWDAVGENAQMRSDIFI